MIQGVPPLQFPFFTFTNFSEEILESSQKSLHLFVSIVLYDLDHLFSIAAFEVLNPHHQVGLKVEEIMIIATKSIVMDDVNTHTSSASSAEKLDSSTRICSELKSIANLSHIQALTRLFF